MAKSDVTPFWFLYLTLKPLCLTLFYSIPCIKYYDELVFIAVILNECNIQEIAINTLLEFCSPTGKKVIFIFS